MAEEKKYAYRRVVKNDENKIRLMFVDASTGEPIVDTEGYTILDQGTEGISGELNLGGKKSSDQKNTDELIKRLENSGGADNGGQEPYNFAGSMPRNPNNNYGFIDKNFAIKALGAFGLPGKAINFAINGNNLEATNAARKTMGLPDLSFREAASALAVGRDGYIADVKIGDQQYAVGLKATDKAGRTTLTPMEARNRSLHTGFGLKEATPQERKQSIADARANPDIAKARGGVVGQVGRAAVGAVTGGLSGAAASVLSNVSLGGPKGTYSPPVSREVAPSPVSQGPSPALGARGASELQGFDARQAVRTDIASPASGARVASGLQSFDPREEISRPGVTRGRGLQDVADVTRSGPRFSYDMGPNRPEAPDEGIQSVVGKAVNSVLGPDATISVVSGQEGPDRPQYGSNRHKTGMAADVQVFDGTGRQITMENSPETMQEIARAAAGLGAKGIGFGQSYMGGVSMHLDMVEPGPGQAYTWGDGPLGGTAMRDELTEDMGEHVARERHVSEGMFPSARPDTVSPAFGAQGARGTQGVVTAEQQLQAAPGSFRSAQEVGMPQETVAEKARQELTSPTGGITQDAVERAQQRVDTRPAEVREAMAFTIAGELGSQTLANIASGDPERMSQARQEIAAIASTIDNRAHSTKFAESANPYGDVLSPSQYNSLMGDKLPTTEANYGEFGDFINQALVDYDFGVNPSPVPNATHYAANYINPSWETSAIGGMVPIGEHKFGTIAMAEMDTPEYSLSGSGFGRVAGGGSSSIGLTNTVDSSGFGSGFSSSFDNSSYGGFSNYGAGSSSGQSRAGVSSENRSGGYDAGRSGESSFGGFSAGSLSGSSSGFGSGYGSAGSGGYSSFSGGRDNSGYSGASYGGSSGPSPSSPAGGAQAAGGYSGGSRSSSSSSSGGGFSSDTYGGSSPQGSGTSGSHGGGAMSGI